MSESPVEQVVRRAIQLVAPDVRPDIIVDDALRNAGMLDIPTDARELQVFVTGPLARSAADRLGRETADRLSTILSKHYRWRSTAVGMPAAESDIVPASNPPDRISVPNVTPRVTALRPRNAQTLSYAAMGESGRMLDVMLYDPDASRADPIANALGDQGLFAAPVTDLAVAEELCATVGPALVLHPADLDVNVVDKLASALGRSDIGTAIIRSYGLAGATRRSQAPDLRYRSLEQLVDRVVHLLDERKGTGSDGA